jgi:putative ABC transport system permease protein
MIRPRWRKVLTDLWDDKMRTLLVVASISVGVFTIGTIAGAYSILSEDMNVSYASSHPANIEIWTDPFDDDFIRSTKKVRGVAEAEGRHITNMRVSRDGESWMNLNLVAIKDYEASDINLRKPLEGAQIPGEREILITRSNFNDTGIRLGDILQVQLSDGTLRNLPVVGVVQEQSSGRGDFTALPNGFITMSTLDWLDQPQSHNRLVATVSGDSDDEDFIQEVSATIEDKLENSGRGIYRTQLHKTNEHPMASLVLAILGVLGALGALTVLLSSSLIANTLNALLSQHLRQIGVMKLVGARSFQILGMYLVLVLSFGVVASMIAVPLGSLAGYALAEFIADQVSIDLQGFRFIPLAVLIQVSVALVVPLAAGFIPVNNGSKTKVRRAISGDRPGEPRNRITGLDHLVRGARWLSRPWLLAVRNTFRRKGRLALTLFTLIIGGAIFIAVFNVRASMEQWMAQLGQYFIADVSLNFEQPYLISEVEQAVFEVPGVLDIEGWSAVSAEILNLDDSVAEDLQILAPPADSPLLDPDILVGRWIYPGEPNALVVSDGIWDLYPDLQPGDRLRLKVVGEREDDWTVVGVFRFSGMLDSVLGYADYKTISQLLNATNRAFSYRVVTDEHSLERQEEIGRALDQRLRARGFRVNDVEAGLATMRDAAESIDVLIGFLLIMALLTALVGSIGLTGTMGMNVLERTREIGVMRAIGAVDLKIINAVIIEGLLIGLISWLFAVLSSFPISYLLLRIISQAMINAPIPLALTPLGMVIWLLVVAILAVLASVLPAHNAARLTIREVLAYE